MVANFAINRMYRYGIRAACVKCKCYKEKKPIKLLNQFCNSYKYAKFHCYSCGPDMELWLSWDNGDDLKIGTGILYATKNILMEITEADLFENVKNMTIGTIYSPTEFSIEKKTSRSHELSMTLLLSIAKC